MLAECDSNLDNTCAVVEKAGPLDSKTLSVALGRLDRAALHQIEQDLCAAEVDGSMSEELNDILAAVAPLDAAWDILIAGSG